MKKRGKLIKKVSRGWDHEDLKSKIRYLEEIISISHTEEELRNASAALKYFFKYAKQKY